MKFNFLSKNYQRKRALLALFFYRFAIFCPFFGKNIEFLLFCWEKNSQKNTRLRKKVINNLVTI